MVADLADGVGPAQALDLAGVLAAVLRAGLLQLAVRVLPAAHLAVACTQAGLLRGAVRVGVAGVDAAAVDALLARGAVAFPRAHQAALLVYAGVAGRAVVVAQADHRLAAATLGRVAAEVGLALAGSCVALGAADGVGAALKVVAGVLAHGLAEPVRVAGQVARTVPVAVGTRVGVAAALAVGVADEAVLADALVATWHVDAAGRGVARVRVAVVDLLAAHECIARVARSAVADALVVLGHAGRVDAAAVHTRVLTVEVGEAGLGDVAVLILEALHLLAPLSLVVGVTDVQTVGTGALWEVVVHHADRTGRALEKLAAVLAPALSVRLVELAHFVGMWAVRVVDALGLWDLAAPVPAVGVSRVALPARATSPVVECDAVCVRSAAEADADFSALHHPDGVGNAGGRGGAAGVIGALVALALDAAEHILPVPDEAVPTLALVRVLPRDTVAVGSALVELAGIEAPLAARVVRAADVGNPLAVVIHLALVLGPATVDRVVRVSLEVLQAMAAGTMVERPADGVRTALLLLARVDAFSSLNADLVRRALVVGSAAFGDRLGREAGDVRVIGITLSAGRAAALRLVVDADAKGVGCTLLIHADGHALPEPGGVGATDEVFPAVHVNLALVWYVAPPDQRVSHETGFAAARWPVVHSLADGPLRAVVALAGVVAVVLAVERPLAHCDGGAVVVSVAAFRLDLTPGRPVVWVAHERLSATALGDVVLRSTDGVLSAKRGCATDETTSDPVVIDAADLIVPAVAVAPALRSRRAALPNVVGDAFEPDPALARSPVVGRDAVCVWPATSIPAGIRAVLDAVSRQQADGGVGAVIVVLAQVPHAAPPEVMRVAREPGQTLAGRQVVHSDAVGVGPALVVQAELDAVLDAHLRQLAHLVALTVNVAVAPVERDGRAAAGKVAGVAVVSLPALADGFVHPANAMRVGSAPSLAASPRAVLDPARVGEAAVALWAVCVVEALVEEWLAAPDSVVGVSKEGVAADTRRQVPLAKAAGVGAARMSQADVHALVPSRLVAAGLMLQAVLVHGAVVWHLAARPVVDVAGEALADGLVVLTQAVGVLATRLVLTHVAALLDALGAQLALKVFPAVVVLQTLVLGFG